MYSDSMNINPIYYHSTPIDGRNRKVTPVFTHRTQNRGVEGLQEKETDKKGRNHMKCSVIIPPSQREVSDKNQQKMSTDSLLWEVLASRAYQTTKEKRILRKDDDFFPQTSKEKFKSCIMHMPPRVPSPIARSWCARIIRPYEKKSEQN